MLQFIVEQNERKRIKKMRVGQDKAKEDRTGGIRTDNVSTCQKDYSTNRQEIARHNDTGNASKART